MQCLADLRGFPGGSTGKNLPANVGAVIQFPGLEDPLEKGMATHSIIFPWRIPCTEEADRLQSMESQRVRPH